MDKAVLEELFPDPLVLTQVDDKSYVFDAARDAVLRKCRMKSDNRCCFECGANKPIWCSVTFGVYLCLDCSGNHRRKGVHISFVRSVDMDKFYPDQLVRMAIGGNGKANHFFKECGMGRLSANGKAVDYQSKNALRYKADLDKNVKAVCESFGVAGRSEDLVANEAPAEVSVENAPETKTEAPPAPEVVWTVGQRIQFRDKGNPTWKWGYVTHRKPLKVDYTAHEEVRNSPASKVYDAAAQRAIAFAPAATQPVVNGSDGTAPAPKVASSPPPAPVVAAPKASATPTPQQSAPATNMVIRKSNNAPAPTAAPSGYLDTKQVAREVEGGDLFGDFEPKAKPKPAPANSPKLAPEKSPSGTEAVDAPAEKPKKKVDEDEFDWDF